MWRMLTLSDRESMPEEFRPHVPAVVAYRFTGDGDIDVTIHPGQVFVPLFVRCHFVAGSGKANLEMHASSAADSENTYDTLLYTDQAVGTGVDANTRWLAKETAWPSPWAFDELTHLRVKWTNPDSGTMVWGMEVGVAVG